jgi:fructan beta-fructosidase
VQDDKSCLVAIFTAAAKDTTTGKEHQDQHLAYSNDRGRTWTEYESNPVADLSKPDFRDPRVFWYEPQNKWVMVAVLADERMLEIFDSKDLKTWKHLGEFGPAGDSEGQWECPDLFELPIQGSDERKWVLVINRNPGAPAGGTGTRYIIGSFDGEKFTPDPTTGTQWADYGKDFYATQRFSSMPPGDSRTVWMGWIGNWQYANKEPTKIWRGAQSLPRELGLRRVSDGLILTQAPVREAAKLREKLVLDVSGASFREANRRIQRAGIRGDTLEIELSFATTSQTAELILRKSATEKTIVGVSAGRAFVDRTQSGEAGFSEDFPGRFSTPKSEQPRSLHVFLDRSSVEVFFNDGEYVLTDRIYPLPESRGVELTSQAPSTRVARLRIWKLKPVWK